MVMVVVVVWRILLINDALDGAKLFNVAWNGDGTLVIKSILFLSFLQKMHEKWMVDVHHRYHKSLTLFLSLSHHHCQTPLWNIVFHFFLLMAVKMDQMWQVDVEIDQMVLLILLLLLFHNSHFLYELMLL